MGRVLVYPSLDSLEAIEGTSEIPKHTFYDEKNERKPFLLVYTILLIKDSLQQKIHFNGNIFRNKYCSYIGSSLYYSMISVYILP